jgi:predicted transcriptional regulator
MAETAKNKVIAAVQALPDDATFDDAVERIVFLAKVETGVEQADTGQLVSHEDVKKRLLK